MGKLIDADLLIADMKERKSETYWGKDSDAFSKGVVYDIDHYLDMLGGESYDAPEEFQPKPKRQTLLEALEGAEIGTRFRHKNSIFDGWVVLVAPGITYSHNDGNIVAGPISNTYRDTSEVRYADEFLIEYPTFEYPTY